MAKVPSPFLTGATGKFAGAAFQQSPGNGTILREVVKPVNPSTEAQVEQRAKFKLMSQVATAFKSVIAMKREGNITPRNMFVKLNSPLLTFDKAQSRAEIELAKLQLTKSAQTVRIETAFDAEARTGGADIITDLPILYGAVFVLIGQRNEQPYIKAIVRESLGEDAPGSSVSGSFNDVSVGDVVLTYGITQDTTGLAVKYGNVESAEGDAWLSILNNLAESSSLTQTVGAVMKV